MDNREAFEVYKVRRNEQLHDKDGKADSRFIVTNAHYPTWQAALSHQAERAEPAMILEVKKDSLFGKQYRILRPDSSLSVGFHPMYTTPQPEVVPNSLEELFGQMERCLQRIRELNDRMEGGPPKQPESPDYCEHGLNISLSACPKCVAGASLPTDLKLPQPPAEQEEE